MAKQKFVLGTAVKISSVINTATATSAIIKIEDPAGSIKVNDLSMTKEADYVYYYVYQSASTDVEGDYVITTSITVGSYTSVVQDKFTLVEQD